MYGYLKNNKIRILAWNFKWNIPQWAGVLVDKRLDRPKSSWLNFFNFVPEIEILRSEGLLGKLGVIWKKKNIIFWWKIKFEIHFTFPSNLRFDDDLGVKFEDDEFAVPNLEDIEE